jgi:predicted DNA-binding transcriptional regulator YafY
LQDAPSSDALVFGVPPPPDPSGWRSRLESAVLRHRRVRLFYANAGGAVSQRRVRPLDVIFEAPEWRLIA